MAQRRPLTKRLGLYSSKNALCSCVRLSGNGRMELFPSSSKTQKRSLQLAPGNLQLMPMIEIWGRLALSFVMSPFRASSNIESYASR